MDESEVLAWRIASSLEVGGLGDWRLHFGHESVILDAEWDLIFEKDNERVVDCWKLCK